MYHYKTIVAVIIAAAFFIPVAYSLTDAQKFAGTFNFINQTLFNQSNGGSPIFGYVIVILKFFSFFLLYIFFYSFYIFRVQFSSH